MAAAPAGSADFLVLHALRCTGAATTERLAEVAGHFGVADAEDRLLALAIQGLVTRVPGEFAGWELTAAGRSSHQGEVIVELEQAGVRDGIEVAYPDFLALNQRVLDLCGLWQLRTEGSSTVLNDHTDAAYDGRVLEEFGLVDAEAQMLCSQLGALLPRFSPYGSRLAMALTRARHGDLTRVTDSMDSYHTVWFQLHEDLLVTLGLTRRS